MVGRTVLHYQFLEKLGQGGMGEIYKAQDTRLNRFVAVKVLTAGRTDLEHRRRFLQEAQAASALNHPNIITIHDIITTEEDGELMVMEFVSGQTLVQAIPKGGLRPPLALQYAVQIADALGAAHSAGIVHRDLKPGNIMVTQSGRIKILDFGLAKLTDPTPQESNNDDSTRTIAQAPLTVEGSILGTVSYMSPEQAQGKKVDARSDVFAFGAVLYEMLTGERAFTGESSITTLSAILRDEVRPLKDVAPDVPPHFSLLIDRCLKKNRDERWQSMQDVLMALQALKRESDSGNLFRTRSMQMPVASQPAPQQPPAQLHDVAAGKRSSKGLIAGLVAAVVLLGGGGFGYWKLKQKRDQDQAATIAAAEKAQNEERERAAAAQAQAAKQATPPPDLGITNDQIIELVANKVPESVILGQIKNAPKTSFTLSTDDLIKLNKAGVNAKLIEAMRDPKKIADAATAQANAAQLAIVKSAAAKVSAPTKQEPIAAPPPVAPVAQPVAEVKPPSPPPVNAVPATVVPTTRPVTIPDGTPFNIAITADVPNDVAEGTALKFVVEQDLKIDGAVVVAKGTAVNAVVIEATKKAKFAGMGGKKATFRPLNTVSAEGKPVRLRATAAKGLTESSLEAQGKKAPKDMVTGAGTTYLAYVDGDQVVNVKK